MKKIVLPLICGVLLTLSAQAQIVITEIMYNPPESGTDSLEYIELYNNSNATVDLSNWTFTQGFLFTFPAGSSLGPNQYVIIAESESAFSGVFGFQPLIWDGALTNSPGEDIELRDANNNVIDYVDYMNVAPWPTGAAGGGHSLVLCDPNADNSLPENWQDATTPVGVTINGIALFANPGAASGCPTGVTAFNDEGLVVSGGSTTIQVLLNDILPGQSSPTTVVITQAPQHGSASVNANNTITYTSNNGYCGNDAFTYQVCEGSDCDEATVNITVRCYPVYSIDQINNVDADGVADSSGIYCELTATVYGVNLRPGGLQFTMIDDSNNGIVVLNFTGDFGYTVTEKDKITVRGQINQFNGLLQIFPDTLFKVSGNNALVSPLVVQTHSEDTESKLIRIDNLRYVDPAQWATGMGSGFSVFMVSDDHPLDTIQVRIDNDVDLFNQPAPPAPFNLTGIGGQFDNSSPYNSGYQILPRYTPDVSTLVGLKEADFSSLIRLSPNPATDHITILSEAAFDAVRLFGVQGALIKTIVRPGLQENVPLESLSPGTYFLRFEKDGAAWTTRFVKF